MMAISVIMRLLCFILIARSAIGFQDTAEGLSEVFVSWSHNDYIVKAIKSEHT